MRRIYSLAFLVFAALLIESGAVATTSICAQRSDSGDLRGRPPAERAGDLGRSQNGPAERESKAAADETAPSEIELLERQCLSEINRLRRAYRLAPLEFNKELLPVARTYSRRMAEEGFFAHTDPAGRGTRDRLDGAGIRWRALAENIASERGWVNPVAVSVHGWMDSAGHRENILSAEFDQTAVGAWITDDGAVYFTQIFIKR